MNDALERPALYYPYVHIRSEHWLKATLLVAPAVKRIVPDTYTPEDSPQITKYTEIQGPYGALLQAVPAFSPAAYDAQLRLLSRLRAGEDQIQRKYQRGQAPIPDEYWIHDAKFNQELLHYLVEHKLAWPSQDPHAYGHRNWYALHPILGSAIMTTLGLSIAREQRYDIVTPSSEFHDTLLASKENEIFEALLRTDDAQLTPTLAQARRDLGQLVITLTGVNYEALRPEDIPELQSSENFRKFQHLIRTRAQSIDPDDNLETYHARLKFEASEIIEAWHDTESALSRQLREVLFEQGLILSAEALKTLIKGRDTTDVLVTGGVAIGLLLSKGLGFREKHHDAPYQYLTEITQAENEFLRMTFPLGLER